MTIRQLELFASVYEERNLTRAAEKLYMTQSAVTQNLKKMEEELGVQLFVRSKRQNTPTPAGKSFYLHTQRILSEYRKALSDLIHQDEELDFCYYDMLPPAIKDKVLASFWTIDPYLTIHQFDRRIIELLDNSRWESGTLYLVPEEFIRDPDMRTIAAARVGHVVIMRETHRLHGRSVVRPEDLEGETILLSSDRGKHFLHLTAALKQLEERNIRFQTAVADQARELIPKILSFGGIAIIPEYLAREVPGIVIKPYADGIDIYVQIAYKGTLSPRVKKLLAAFRKGTPALYGTHPIPQEQARSEE